MKGTLGNFGNNFFKFFSLLAFPVSCLAIYQGEEKPPNTVPVGIWIVSMKYNNGPQAGEGNSKIPKWLEVEYQEERKLLCFSTFLCGNAQASLPAMETGDELVVTSHSGRITQPLSILQITNTEHSIKWELRIWFLQPARLYLSPSSFLSLYHWQVI